VARRKERGLPLRKEKEHSESERGDGPEEDPPEDGKAEGGEEGEGKGGDRGDVFVPSRSQESTEASSLFRQSRGGGGDGRERGRQAAGRQQEGGRAVEAREERIASSYPRNTAAFLPSHVSPHMVPAVPTPYFPPVAEGAFPPSPPVPPGAYPYAYGAACQHPFLPPSHPSLPHASASGVPYPAAPPYVMWYPYVAPSYDSHMSYPTAHLPPHPENLPRPGQGPWEGGETEGGDDGHY
jgi:hypothetical protein